MILPDANCSAIAMLPTAAGWALPSLHDESGIWLAETAAVAASLRRGIGLDGAFTILRYVSLKNDEAEAWTRIVWVLEPHEPAMKPPPGAAWVTEANLLTVRMAEPEQRPALLSYFAERGAAIPKQRAPWAREGWYAAAAGWMQISLAELGYVATGPVEQLRNWSISSLLRMPTTEGNVYFKAAADLPLFVNEPRIVAKLASLFPDHILPPLCVDEARRWLLMEDFGPPLRSQPGGDLAPVLNLFGELQRRSAGHVDGLLAAGAHDRRLAVLASQIDPLLAHPITQASLEPGERAALVTFAEPLKQRCAALAGDRIPATLVHGDLHLGNVAQRHGAYLYFDWTDACISHPFLDMLQPYFFAESEQEKERLRDAYLEQWTEYEPRERLREIWVLAKPLAAMHQAVSYLTIVENLEPLVREELLHGLPQFLRYALAALQS